MNTRIPLDEWRFHRGPCPGAPDPSFPDDSWEQVRLPHTVRTEASYAGAVYQGECWYRTVLRLERAEGRRHFLSVGAAMHVADLWVGGKRVGTYRGGYLPFVVDLAGRAVPGADTPVAIRFDNRDNPDVPPGRPEKQLDFHYYGGLHRTAHLEVVDDLHVTDALFEDEPAGGGIFVTYPSVSEAEAEVAVKVHVRNDGGRARECAMRVTLRSEGGELVLPPATIDVRLLPGEARHHRAVLRVPSPRLWHPRHPELHELIVELVEAGETIHRERRAIGIRSIDVSAEGGLRINGQPFFARGANRHNEYPHLGNAVPDNASFRDAVKIKEAGFDYVRLSHYPQPDAFLEACDRLGILVMDSIPGWQFLGGDAFTANAHRDIRGMIRRDRNHPCVFLWEACLNEALLTDAWCAEAHQVARAEFEGPGFHTCGYHDAGYDVFLGNPAHGDWGHGCSPYHYLNPGRSAQRRANRGRPVIVSEYGDWEYHAYTAGYDQQRTTGYRPPETTSRQRRADGEARLLRQARNFQESHGTNLGMRVIGDGIWVMFDYNRGCHPDIESSGIMDVFRLPKFAYHFFRSQRDAEEESSLASAGLMVFIATHWTPASSPDIVVYTNGDGATLTLNGRPLPGGMENGGPSGNLRHRPLLFHAGSFQPGVLKAEARGGGKVAVHEVRTPGEAKGLEMAVDLSGRPLLADGVDAVFLHARVVDAAGTLVPSAVDTVRFFLTGAEPVFTDSAAAEAGIASVLVRARRGAAACAIRAEATGLIPGELSFPLDPA